MSESPEIVVQRLFRELTRESRATAVSVNSIIRFIGSLSECTAEQLDTLRTYLPADSYGLVEFPEYRLAMLRWIRSKEETEEVVASEPASPNRLAALDRSREIESLQATIQHREDQYNQLKNQLRLLEERFDDTESIKASLVEENAVLRDRASHAKRLQEDLKQAQSELEDLRGDFTEVADRLQTHEHQLARAQKERDHAEARVKQLEENNRKLQEQALFVATEKTRFLTLQHQAESMSRECQSLRDENTLLASMLREKDAVTIEVRTLTTTNRELSSKCYELERMLDGAREEIRLAQEENARLAVLPLKTATAPSTSSLAFSEAVPFFDESGHEDHLTRMALQASESSRKRRDRALRHIKEMNVAVDEEHDDESLKPDQLRLELAQATADLAAKVAALESAKQKAENLLTQAHEENTILQQRVDALEEERRQLLLQIDLLTATHTQAQKASQLSLEQLNQTVFDLKSLEIRHNNVVSDLNARILQMQKEAGTLRATLHDSTLRLELTTTTIGQHENEVKRMTEELVHAQQLLRLRDESLRSLQDRFDSLEQSYQAVNNELASERHTLLMQVRSTTSQVDELNRLVKDEELRSQTLETNAESAQQQAQQSREEAAALAERVRILESDLVMRDAALDSQKSDLQTQLAWLKEKEVELSQLQQLLTAQQHLTATEALRVTEVLEVNQRLLDDHHEEREELQSRIADLEDRLQALQVTVQTQNEELHDFRALRSSHHTHEKHELQAHHDELTQLRLHIQQLEEQLESARAPPLEPLPIQPTDAAAPATGPIPASFTDEQYRELALQVQQLQDSKAQLQAAQLEESTTWQSKLADAQLAIATLERQLEERTDEYRQLHHQFQDFERTASSKEADLREETARFEDELRTAHLEIEELRMENRDSKAALGQLKIDDETVAAELRTEVDQLLAKIKRITEHNNEDRHLPLVNVITEVQAMLATCRTSCDELKVLPTDAVTTQETVNRYKFQWINAFDAINVCLETISSIATIGNGENVALERFYQHLHTRAEVQSQLMAATFELRHLAGRLGLGAVSNDQAKTSIEDLCTELERINAWDVDASGSETVHESQYYDGYRDGLTRKSLEEFDELQKKQTACEMTIASLKSRLVSLRPTSEYPRTLLDWFLRSVAFVLMLLLAGPHFLNSSAFAMCAGLLAVDTLRSHFNRFEWFPRFSRWLGVMLLLLMGLLVIWLWWASTLNDCLPAPRNLLEALFPSQRILRLGF